MQLGFVSAILPDLPLDEVLAFAADEDFACVELMCWPVGGAARRYAGVTHLDVTTLDDDHADRVRELAQRHGVAISGLGYYPNPLDANPHDRRTVIEHLKRVIGADPRAPGLWHACGHEGAGIGLAPATGELVADWFTGTPTQVPLSWFSPDRFAPVELATS